jgi:hypothetical protein
MVLYHSIDASENVNLFLGCQCPFKWTKYLSYHLTTYLLSVQVKTEEEVVEAIKTSLGPKKDFLCFIEVIVHKDDTSKELLEWGSRASAAKQQATKSSVGRI